MDADLDVFEIATNIQTINYPQFNLADPILLSVPAK